MSPPSMFFSDLEFVHNSFCELVRATTSLPLCPPPPIVHAVRPTPPAQGRGQSKACWDWGGGVGGLGLLGVSWHCATPPPPPQTAWSDWEQRGRLLYLRLMRTGLWSGYRVLQNRRPAGTSCPLCRAPPQPFVLALSELLIVLMNILEASRNGSSGLGVWFQWLWQLMIHSMTREGGRWRDWE